MLWLKHRKKSVTVVLQSNHTWISVINVYLVLLTIPNKNSFVNLREKIFIISSKHEICTKSFGGMSKTWKVRSKLLKSVFWTSRNSPWTWKCIRTVIVFKSKTDFYSSLKLNRVSSMLYLKLMKTTSSACSCYLISSLSLSPYCWFQCPVASARTFPLW